MNSIRMSQKVLTTGTEIIHHDYPKITNRYTTDGLIISWDNSVAKCHR